MRLYSCQKCKRGACPRRSSSRISNGIKELMETTTHEDGTKERWVWARIDVKTDQPLEVNLMGKL